LITLLYADIISFRNATKVTVLNKIIFYYYYDSDLVAVLWDMNFRRSVINCDLDLSPLSYYDCDFSRGLLLYKDCHVSNILLLY